MQGLPPVALEASQEVGGIERREGAMVSDMTTKVLASSSPTTMIQALQIFSRDLQKDTTEGAILGKKQQVEEARKQIQEALERAQREAGEKASMGRWTGVLSTVAKVAAVAAAVSSVVLTGGVSAPLLIGLAGTLLSVTARPLAGAVGGGEGLQNALRYGGAGVSVLAGGAGLFTGASAATGSAAAVAQLGSKLGTVVGGAATAGSGYTSFQAGMHGAKMTEAQADEKQHRAEQKQMLRQVEQLIEVLQEVEQSFQRSAATMQKTKASEAASGLALAAGVRA
jgi:hypothetical protein